MLLMLLMRYQENHENCCQKQASHPFLVIINVTIVNRRPLPELH